MILNRPKDIYAGLIFGGIGIAAYVSAQSYPIGSANRMGPGYLPAALGIVLTGIGLFLLFMAFRNKRPDLIERHALEPFVLIVLSVLAFAFLIDRAGLIPAMFALVMVSCARRALKHPIEVFMTFAVLTAFCVLLFVYLLGMQIPLLW